MLFLDVDGQNEGVVLVLELCKEEIHALKPDIFLRNEPFVYGESSGGVVVLDEGVELVVLERQGAWLGGHVVVYPWLNELGQCVSHVPVPSRDDWLAEVH